MSTSLYSVCVYRLRNSLNFAGVLRIPRRTVPLNHSAARMSTQSTKMTPSTRDLLTKRACASFLPSLSITLSSESNSDEHRLPVLEKHDPTWSPRDLPNPSLIVSTPMPKDKSDYEARFDALKHEVEQASQTIVSRHVEESDRRLREERLRKRTPVPSVVITIITLELNLGPESQRRVPWGSRLAVESPSPSCPSCLSLPPTARMDSRRITRPRMYSMICLPSSSRRLPPFSRRKKMFHFDIRLLSLVLFSLFPSIYLSCRDQQKL
jgi:hypothetical protein